MPLRQTREFVDLLRKSADFTASDIISYNEQAKEVFFQFSIFKCLNCLKFIHKQSYQDHCKTCIQGRLVPEYQHFNSQIIFPNQSLVNKIENSSFENPSSKSYTDPNAAKQSLVQNPKIYVSFKTKCEEIARSEINDNVMQIENQFSTKNSKESNIQNFNLSAPSEPIVQKQDHQVVSKNMSKEAMIIKSPVILKIDSKLDKTKFAASSRNIKRSVEPLNPSKDENSGLKQSPTIFKRKSEVNCKQFGQKISKSDIAEDKNTNMLKELSKKSEGQKLMKPKSLSRLSEPKTKKKISELELRVTKPKVYYKIDLNVSAVLSKDGISSQIQKQRTPIHNGNKQNSQKPKVKSDKETSESLFSKLKGATKSSISQLNLPSLQKIGHIEAPSHNSNRTKYDSIKIAENLPNHDLITIIDRKIDDDASRSGNLLSLSHNNLENLKFSKVKKEDELTAERNDSTKDLFSNYSEMRLIYKKSKASIEVQNKSDLDVSNPSITSKTVENFSKNSPKFSLPLAGRAGISERVFAITQNQSKPEIQSQKYVFIPDKLCQINHASNRSINTTPFKNSCNLSMIEEKHKPNGDHRLLISTENTISKNFSNIRKSLDELSDENNEWRRVSREKRIERLAERIEREKKESSFPENTEKTKPQTLTGWSKDKFSQSNNGVQTLNAPKIFLATEQKLPIEDSHLKQKRRANGTSLTDPERSKKSLVSDRVLAKSPSPSSIKHRNNLKRK